MLYIMIIKFGKYIREGTQLVFKEALNRMDLGSMSSEKQEVQVLQSCTSLPDSQSLLLMHLPILSGCA